MNIIKKEDKTFQYKVTISDLEDHYEMIENTKDGLPVIERTELCYSKSTDKFYISNYYSSPDDSYGCNWYISDSGCHSYDEEELTAFIKELIKLRRFRKTIKRDVK